MTAPSPSGTAQTVRPSRVGLEILAELAPTLVPVLYEVGEKTWPREREPTHKRWGVVGPEVTVREQGERRFTVLLRKRDLFTVQLNWRLEAAGPIEFFEWDDSGRITGTYGVRSQVITLAPVAGDDGAIVGFAVNARASANPTGLISAIDARLDSAEFVRTTSPDALVAALKTVVGRPRTEEARPGIEPSHEYFEVLHLQNKTGYFKRHGANEYIGQGWTSTSIERAFDNRNVRALVIGNPAEPSLTPEPMEH